MAVRVTKFGQDSLKYQIVIGFSILVFPEMSMSTAVFRGLSEGFRLSLRLFGIVAPYLEIPGDQNRSVFPGRLFHKSFNIAEDP